MQMAPQGPAPWAMHLQTCKNDISSPHSLLQTKTPAKSSENPCSPHPGTRFRLALSLTPLISILLITLVTLSGLDSLGRAARFTVQGVHKGFYKTP